MKSLLALINAKVIFKSAPVLEPETPSTYGNDVNSVLVKDGRIHLIGSTSSVLEAFEILKKDLSLDDKETAVDGGRKRSPKSRIIDCRGQYAVYPGFIDSHAHFLDGGRSINNPVFDHASSREEFVSILRAYYESQYDASGRDWIVGGGWSESVLGESPTRDWLDAVSAEIPIVLYRKDVHSCVLNTAALRWCHVLEGCTDGAPLIREVVGGRVELDANGVPNGVMRDNAILAVSKYFPATDTLVNKERALTSASEYYLSRGFTTVYTMMSTRYRDNNADVQFLRTKEEEGALRLRIRYGVPLDLLDTVSELFTAVEQAERTDPFALPYRFTNLPPERGGSFLFLGAVKLFGDGALGSKTAAMNRPYGYDVQTEGDINSDLDQAEIEKIVADPDRPECQCGLMVLQKDALQSAVQRTHSRHMQIVAHAIGDRAVANVNKVLSEAGEALRSTVSPEGKDYADFHQDPRSRVEHCQHINNVAKEVSRMKRNNIIASMQPCHLLFDGDYVESLIGINRKNKSYLWGTFLRNGIRVNLGSDWPVAPADVEDGLRGAVTRVPDVMVSLAAEKNGKKIPEGLKRYHEVWNENEIISMDAALRSYTFEAAHGAFLEDFVGSLEEGKYADITIWSDDWLDDSKQTPLGDTNQRWWVQSPPPQLLATIVGGLVEYEVENL